MNKITLSYIYISCYILIDLCIFISGIRNDFLGKIKVKFGIQDNEGNSFIIYIHSNNLW